MYWLSFTYPLCSSCRDFCLGFFLMGVFTHFQYNPLNSHPQLAWSLTVCASFFNSPRQYFPRAMFPFRFVPMARIVSVFILEVPSQECQRGGEREDAQGTAVLQLDRIMNWWSWTSDKKIEVCISRGSLQRQCSHSISNVYSSLSFCCAKSTEKANSSIIYQLKNYILNDKVVV